MQAVKTRHWLSLPSPAGFSLSQTLDCGQCFRWKIQPDNSWTGVVSGSVYRLREGKECLHIECLSAPSRTAEETSAFFRSYFDFDTDYQAIQSMCGAHPALREAAAFAGGIRILRQEPWEALCTFILSQNNNIKRIAGLAERLCENFGQAIPAEDGDRYFSFPSAERLAPLTTEDLAPVRCGFRAKYVLDAAKKAASGEIRLEELRQAPTPEAMERLMEIKGVGPKVAQCALLFGLHKLDCLPRDVWIGRALDALFPEGFPEEVLPVAGAAQQYLFHYVRHHPEVLEDGK